MLPNGPKSHASNGGSLRPGLNLLWPVPFPNYESVEAGHQKRVRIRSSSLSFTCPAQATFKFTLASLCECAILRPADRMAGVLNGGSAARLSFLVKIQRFRVPWEWIMECRCGTNGPRPRDRNPSCQRRMMGSIISGCRAHRIGLPGAAIWGTFVPEMISSLLPVWCLPANCAGIGGERTYWVFPSSSQGLTARGAQPFKRLKRTRLNAGVQKFLTPSRSSPTPHGNLYLLPCSQESLQATH